jgi:hypothetical protein
MSQVVFVNIADCKDPDDPQGRSYREVNAEKQHSIPLGTLVEIDNGCRLFVVNHGRDCDQTPLYGLSADKDDIVQHDTRFVNSGWTFGHTEESLKVIPKSS